MTQHKCCQLIDPMASREESDSTKFFSNLRNPGEMQAYVTVNGISDNASLLYQSVPTPASWGFSPDDDRFVIQTGER